MLRALRGQGLEGLLPVHRLDKDASGVLLLARSKAAARALERRWDEVEKTYLALAEGVPLGRRGVINAPILENQTGKPERLKRALEHYAAQHGETMVSPLPAPKTSAIHPAGRCAETRYRVSEEFALARSARPREKGKRTQGQRSVVKWSWLELKPRQGRMHQIRVHLAYIGCPLVGDALYGPAGTAQRGQTDNPETDGKGYPSPLGRPAVSAPAEPARSAKQRAACESAFADLGLCRLALHAAKLVFPHPDKPGERIAVEAPLPEDLAAVLEYLRARSQKPKASATVHPEPRP